MTDQQPTIVLDLVPLQERVEGLDVITCDEDARYVADVLHAVKAMRVTVAETFDPHIARAYQAHRALCQEKQRNDKALADAETRAKHLLAEWDTAQQRARDAERVQHELAQVTANALLEGEALAAEAQGDLAAADLLRAQQSTVLAVVEPVATPSGISYRETWHARVVDLAALVQAAASHPPYVALLLPDMRALNGMAKSLKRRFHVPGVEAYATKDVAARSR